MKRLLIILCFIGCTACAFRSTDSNNKDKIIEEPDRILEKLNTMSLDEKIGQLFIIQDRKAIMDEEMKDVLYTIKPGGFIFFSENFQSLEQTEKLIGDIKGTSDIPMFLAIDQEGGRVQRLKTLKGASITRIPSMAKIGASGDDNLAYDTGSTIGHELSLFGINMDFAPVLDVNTKSYNTVIGDRSFGYDPLLVSKMGVALAKGLKDNGVIPVYKHFPGHGSTKTDSHLQLPILTKTKEELMDFDIIPFKDAIKDGAAVIMIGHLAVPNITSDNVPASLSKEIINDFLKDELGFEGLVVTDALNMKAITDNYTQKDIYKMAINAGVDLLLMPKDSLEAFNMVKELVSEGTISEEQIDKSVKKILTLKSEYLGYNLD